MKLLKISLVLLLVLIVAFPLYGRRGRGTKSEHGYAISLYGGLEDLTGETTADSSMFFSFGGAVIVPVYKPLFFRIGLAKISIYEGGKTMAFGTGINGDIMYYWEMPMAFTPYGFGGFWITNTSNGTSTTVTKLRAGLGGEFTAMYNFFVEGGLEYNKMGDADAVNTFHVHGGVRFPLFR
jgi:hypothetical protein